MKIKKGDTVQIMVGKDAGKTGKVLKVLPKENRLTVEGLNLVIKHLRPKRVGEKGQRVQFPAPLQISNIALLCPKCSRPTRVGFEVIKGKKMRQCRRCKAVFT